MKLYVYDHCPYCVRARMIFGLKKLPVDLIMVLNDDEQTPVNLIGKKAVPILITDEEKAMPESLDIVCYVDSHYGTKCLLDNVRPEIENWISKASQYVNYLLLPRFIKLGLPEYQTQSAVDYFVKKKTEAIGDFDTHQSKTTEYLTRLHRDLEELSALFINDEAVNGHLSYEDILLFPILRNLTCVKGLILPTNIAQYVANMAVASRIDLYYSKAC
ncbi:glutaredoxin 2 [Volucribacter psittacicida]|uniref:Glutaredoxin 2 n=1 Tax=Volucribacter psittacicida TaxID=203482 RepID=A0A4R1G5V2_9PAST|nr:glutaredoxin 2 [Volucribacter psittacicida]TCK01910.1 glutaredoxin 2 [Volucribacter psittacicida]